MAISYKINASISLDAFIDIYRRSTLGERRPVDKPAVMAQMLENASVTVTAWDGDNLVGIARTLSDHAYIAYLSDLAVDITYQKQGIGRQLIEETRKGLGPDCTLVLLAAPAAQDYYPRIGFEQHHSAWTLTARQNLV
jgi:ribosomal protein S18 acetylase RimI-like enzyme